MRFSSLRLACALTAFCAIFAPFLANAQNLITIDLSYVDQQSQAFSRFKSWVDQAVGGDPDYGFSATDAAYMGKITGQQQYCALAVQMTDQQVSDAESAIASGDAPDVAYDSYLYSGGMISDLALTYDWCFAQTSESQRTRWTTYANQTLFNIWNYSLAQWGGQAAPWSGWGTDDPGNNYHFSFLEATMYWAIASGSVSVWQPYLENVKLPLVEQYYAALPGGGSEEGTGYGVSQRNLFALYRMWYDCIGTDLGNASSHMSDSIAYWVHATVPTMDRFAPIGDQSRSSVPWLYDYHRDLVLEARAQSDDDAMRDLASWWLNSISVDHMSSAFNYRDDLLPAGTNTTPPSELSYHAQGVGVMFARTGWDPGATWLTFIAGPYTQSHAHQEQGAFTLFGAGDWLAVTENIWSHSGIQADTSTNNVVRFVHDGNTIRQTQPSTSDMTFTSNGSSVQASGDLTPAFGGDPNVSFWQRGIDFTGGILTVTDNFSVTSGTQAIFQVNVPVQPVISGHTATAGALRITVVEPADATLSAVDWTTVDGDYSSGWRIDVVGSGSQFVVQLGIPDQIFAGGFEQ